MSRLREPSRDTPLVGEEASDFEEAYAFIQQQSLEWVRTMIRRINPKWPASRLVIKVLSPVEAAERLADPTLRVLALAKALVIVEDQERKLYTIRTPDLATGVRVVHHALIDTRMGAAVKQTFGKNLDA